MMTDHRTLPDPRMTLSGDPRSPVHSSDPRLTSDPRLGLMAGCNCGMPNCVRISHHLSHQALQSPEGHLAVSHGIPGVSLGAAQVDPALLYQMGAAYGLGDNADVLRALPHLNGYYPYDPSAVYPYINGYGGIDARRKNATKESTNTLKAWLFEHRKNPYPTKGEKIMLAILTKMTLTQVSTWFANARRRLKKENKVTWVSKDDDMDDDDSDVNISGDAHDDDNGRHHGSMDDDDNFSLISDKDASEIDVEENNDLIDSEIRVPPILTNGHHSGILTGSNTQTSASVTDSEIFTDKDSDSKNKTNENDPKTRTASEDSTQVITSSSPSQLSGQSSQSATSSATIHHHPVTSSIGNTSPRRSAASLPKPKIWSIADVVSSTGSDKSSSTAEVTSSRPFPVNVQSFPSPMLSLSGATVRPGSMHHVDNGLSYYPYALTHAGVMMSSHAASHMRISHPYARPGHPPASHLTSPTSHVMPPTSHLMSSTSHLIPPTLAREHPLVSYAKLSQSHSGHSKSLDVTESRKVSPHRHDNNNSPKNSDPRCTPTAFTSIARRQV